MAVAWGASVDSAQESSAEGPGRRHSGAVETALGVQSHPDALTAHREDDRQQVWLLEGSVLHFAGDLDAICLA